MFSLPLCRFVRCTGNILHASERSRDARANDQHWQWNSTIATNNLSCLFYLALPWASTDPMITCEQQTEKQIIFLNETFRQFTDILLALNTVLNMESSLFFSFIFWRCFGADVFRLSLRYFVRSTFPTVGNNKHEGKVIDGLCFVFIFISLALIALCLNSVRF